MTLNYERAAAAGELFIDEGGLGHAVVTLPPARRGPVLFFTTCIATFLVFLCALLWLSGGPITSKVAGAVVAGLLGCGAAAVAVSTERRQTLDLSPNGFRFRSSIRGAFREEWVVLWLDVREIAAHPVRHVIELRLAGGSVQTRWLDCRGMTSEQTERLAERLEEGRKLRLSADTNRTPSS